MAIATAWDNSATSVEGPRPLEPDYPPAPPPPAGFVPRPRLIARLAEPTGPPLVVVAAPAGYGKTSLLCEWDRSDERPFAWVALSDADNDPRVLTAAIEQGMSEVGNGHSFVLVIDDLHVLHSERSHETLRGLAGCIPSGSRLALASRTEPALPIGRLRAHRTLTEIRAADLAMTAIEAAALLAKEGIHLAPGQVQTLVRRTEGWPAGLYLAALSLRERGDVAAGVAQFGGGDAAVSDYLRDVVLSELSDDAVRFLVRTAILDRLSGPVCDAVLDARGSARMLDEIGRANLLLTRLDGKGESYRCHRLLSEMLRAELRVSDPYAEPELRCRAAEWYAARTDPDRAIGHAVAAGASGRAGELLWQNAPELVSKGRNDKVRGWLATLTDEQIAADPHVALVAAISHLAAGDVDSVQRWEAVVSRRLRKAASGEHATLEAGVLVLRAALARDGVRRMRDDAARAYGLLPDDSPCRSVSCLLEGVARHLTGDAAGAEARLEEGVRRGALAAPNVQALCLAQLALVAAERDDWESSAALCARARAQVDHFALAEYPTSALVFAVAALVRARRGRVEEARKDAHQARRLLAMLVDFAPWYDVEARILLARAGVRLGDLPGARQALCDAARMARRAPDAVVLQRWIDEVEEQADVMSTAALPGPASLTGAELRILRFLPTHLSFREIAARLYVSANTVKTQAHAVYRKLGASSRSQAVTRATELGLLDL